MTQTLQTIPLLRSFDAAKALAFYVDFLGFKVDWQHRFHEGAPLYMQLSRGGCVLHLTEHHGDCMPGATVFVRITGLSAPQAELQSRPYANARPGIEAVPWNARMMEIADPFGNRLRFNEDL